MTYFCDRCGLEFVEKKHIKQHLKKKLSCMPIKSEIEALVQLEELNKKDGVKCDICNKIYKNLESLRNHRKRNGLQKIYDNTELKILELIDESDEAVIKKYVKPKQIERFNKETDLLEWADVIDIREEDVKLIDDRIDIIATKEQEIEQKKRERELDKKRKELDSLMMRAVSKKDSLQITST
jgi:DNA-directed RNA polymerase subunit RPC12/RpoP